MMSKQQLLSVAATLIPLYLPSLASAQPQCDATAELLVTGLDGGSGSTIGPGGALYVTEAVAGRISRIDPRTGEVTTFATGLPTRVVGTGGAMDIAFIGHTAYVLVTLVGPDVGGSDVVGIYRVDGPDSFTVMPTSARSPWPIRLITSFLSPREFSMRWSPTGAVFS
jgi:hypothetical protein